MGTNTGRRARRRSERARARSGSSQLPDWVWGAGFGAIIVVFVGFWIALGLVNGGSAAACDKALAPLGTSDVSAGAFANEEIALTRVVDALNRGDRAGAEAQFYGPIHGFTHNVDPPVRERDEALAKRLKEVLVKMHDPKPKVVRLDKDGEGKVTAGDIAAVRDILREVAVALGYPDPKAEP